MKGFLPKGGNFRRRALFFVRAIKKLKKLHWIKKYPQKIIKGVKVVLEHLKRQVISKIILKKCNNVCEKKFLLKHLQFYFYGTPFVCFKTVFTFYAAPPPPPKKKVRAVRSFFSYYIYLYT